LPQGMCFLSHDNYISEFMHMKRLKAFFENPDLPPPTTILGSEPRQFIEIQRALAGIMRPF